MIGQRGAGLDERIAWALADARVTLPLPVVLIGMDTPQVTPALLAAAAEPLVSRSADATFGMAEDGGFWLLGLREVDPDLILGVPMSKPDTGPRSWPGSSRPACASRCCPNSPTWTRSATPSASPPWRRAPASPPVCPGCGNAPRSRLAAAR